MPMNNLGTEAVIVEAMSIFFWWWNWLWSYCLYIDAQHSLPAKAGYTV